MDVAAYNRRAWDQQVRAGDRWTVPVDAETIARARDGDWSVILTPERPVPRDWFPEDLTGARVLGLASGGGQQMPILAAAGATVTTFDASEGQLGQDRLVAEREGLAIETVRGDMRDLGAFEDESFDLVFHPVSNVFVEDVRPVWREVARVLRVGGELLAGFINPLYFLFDDDELNRGHFVVRYRVPYADTEQLGEAKLEAFMAQDEPLCFGHTLTDQIGGQLDAGLALVAMYEDRWGDGKALDDRIDTFVATRSRKL
ncbi:MAG: class I SAM-dependent methyltransferase [Polyangiaceae bacterium]